MGISDTEIEKELQRYREYVLSNISNILDEFVSNTNLISVTIESFYKRPDDNLLKQLALYIDQVIISDPLFELTEIRSESSEVMSKYYGMKDGKLDRKN